MNEQKPTITPFAAHERTWEEHVERDGDVFVEGIGCSEDDLDVVCAQCGKIDDKKKIHVVKYWNWLDLQDDVERKVADYAESRLPSIIYANKLIHSLSNTAQKDEWIQSSMLVKFHAPAIFETRNTFYVLAGKGVRKDISVTEAFTHKLTEASYHDAIAEFLKDQYGP